MKTISLKKVSAVAVASLGFGLLSVISAPTASAAELGTAGAGGTVTAITASVVTVTPEQNSAVFVKFGASLAALTANSNNSADQITFKAALTSVPSGGSVGVTSVVAGSAVPTGTAVAITRTGGVTPTLTASASLPEFTAVLAAENDTAWSAQTSSYLGAFKFTPTKAGAYTMSIWSDYDLDGTLDQTEVYQTVSITVAALAGLSTSLSTAYMAAGSTAADLTNNLTDAAYTSTTDLVQRAAYKTSGTNISEIQVILKDSDGTTAAAGHTISCQVTGAGFCAVGDTVGEDNTTGVTLRADEKDLAGNVGYVSIASDGTTGPGSVEIKVTDDVTDAVTSLAKKSWYVYGDVTTLTVTQILKIGKAGGGNVGYSGPTRSASAIPATVVLATDALGQPADITASGVPTLVPTDVTNSSGGTCVKDGGASPVYSSGKGFGYYNCDLSTPSSAVSGKTSATIARIVSPADATLYIKSAEFTTSVGGSVSSAKETLTFDKASYAPGEAMVITRTAVDSSGNPVWDGSASPEVRFSKAVGGTSPVAAGAYVGGKSASSTTVAGATVFAPVIAGSFTAIMTGGATGAATNGITASASVTDANAGLLTQIDALNAKIVALNALIAKIMKKLGVK